MASDCCVPVPHSLPSAGRESESVAARGVDSLRVVPITKQLSYLLRTAELEDEWSERKDLRAWKLQKSIGRLLSGDHELGAGSVAQKAWATRANWT